MTQVPRADLQPQFGNAFDKIAFADETGGVAVKPGRETTHVSLVHRCTWGHKYGKAGTSTEKQGKVRKSREKYGKAGIRRTIRTVR